MCVCVCACVYVCLCVCVYVCVRVNVNCIEFTGCCATAESAFLGNRLKTMEPPSSLFSAITKSRNGCIVCAQGNRSNKGHSDGEGEHATPSAMLHILNILDYNSQHTYMTLPFLNNNNNNNSNSNSNSN